MIQSEIVIKKATSENELEKILQKIKSHISYAYQFLNAYNATNNIRLIRTKLDKLRKKYDITNDRDKKDIFNLFYVGSIEIVEFVKNLRKVKVDGQFEQSPHNYINRLIKLKYPTLQEIMNS